MAQTGMGNGRAPVFYYNSRIRDGEALLVLGFTSARHV
jgi:hypothetical protein